MSDIQVLCEALAAAAGEYERCQYCDGQGSNPSKENPRLTAADALAEMLTSNHVVSILALLTDIAFSCDKINKNEYKKHMETAKKLSAALREYREVSGA